MYTRVYSLQVLSALIIVSSATTAAAQAPAPAAQEHHHEEMEMPREGSGTSWLPDITPMYAIHSQRGQWQFMAHGNAFLQYLHESGNRGDDQPGSINWVMGMAQRNIGPGRLMLRGMFSAEPWTIRGCGYPDLLASGERCDGEKIHDRQHPHDLMMELAAQYSAPLRGSVRWQLYGGPVGEPALGPVAFPHRVSAMPNPLAPIGHHWLDATHITFGVATAGILGDRWKGEGSVFNGREPDENRKDVDFGALDSFSGRFWFLPMEKLAFQVSAGKLTEAEPGEHGHEANDVTRITTSATYHSAPLSDAIWATTVAWGRNEESGLGTHAFLAESTVTFADRDSVYGRFEVVGKTDHDLDLGETNEVFTVAKLQGGYTRYFRNWKGLKPGLGISVSAGFVPNALEAAYGGRVNAGVAVYATLRPAAMMMRHSGAAQGAKLGTGAAPALLSVAGRVNSIEGAHLMITTDEGKSAMIMLGSGTKVTRAGTSIDPSELRPGDRVAVQGSGEPEMISAIAIEVLAP